MGERRRSPTLISYIGMRRMGAYQEPIRKLEAKQNNNKKGVESINMGGSAVRRDGGLPPPRRGYSKSLSMISFIFHRSAESCVVSSGGKLAKTKMWGELNALTPVSYLVLQIRPFFILSRVE